jgi:hypothetical protein
MLSVVSGLLAKALFAFGASPDLGRRAQGQGSLVQVFGEVDTKRAFTDISLFDA